jgi:hypothetical protein
MTQPGSRLRRMALAAVIACMTASGIALKYAADGSVASRIAPPPPPPLASQWQRLPLPPAPDPAAGTTRSVPTHLRASHGDHKVEALSRTVSPPRAPARTGPVLLEHIPEPAELVVCHSDEETSTAAVAIHACIDRAAPNSTVEILPGRYILHRQLVISKPLTIRTATSSSDPPPACTFDEEQCAVLVAAVDLVAQWGPLLVQSTDHVTLEHIVIDGNREARSASDATRRCQDGDNTYGFNVSVLDCASCTVSDIVSTHAICGTGMVWIGAEATIQYSAFRVNGDSATRIWSDGLTLLFAPRSAITDNEFVDNTDVALIIGYGVDSRLERNTVLQRTQPAFAGLMLDNFDSNDLTSAGDFRGAVVAHNRIDCAAQLCTFGIQLGPRPWHATQNIIGGELHDNEVLGAKIGINADGAGVRDAPTTVYGNSIEGVSPGGHFAGCAERIPADAINVAPTSVVDRRGDPMQAGSHPSDWCQLWSAIAGEE